MKFTTNSVQIPFQLTQNHTDFTLWTNINPNWIEIKPQQFLSLSHGSSSKGSNSFIKITLIYTEELWLGHWDEGICCVDLWFLSPPPPPPPWGYFSAAELICFSLRVREWENGWVLSLPTIQLVRWAWISMSHLLFAHTRTASAIHTPCFSLDRDLGIWIKP